VASASADPSGGDECTIVDAAGMLSHIVGDSLVGTIVRLRSAVATVEVTGIHVAGVITVGVAGPVRHTARCTEGVDWHGLVTRIGTVATIITTCFVYAERIAHTITEPVMLAASGAEGWGILDWAASITGTPLTTAEVVAAIMVRRSGTPSNGATIGVSLGIYSGAGVVGHTTVGEGEHTGDIHGVDTRADKCIADVNGVRAGTITSSRNRLAMSMCITVATVKPARLTIAVIITLAITKPVGLTVLRALVDGTLLTAVGILADNVLPIVGDSRGTPCHRLAGLVLESVGKSAGIVCDAKVDEGKDTVSKAAGTLRCVSLCVHGIGAGLTTINVHGR